MIKKEIWKGVKNFEGYYEVSNLGNVRSLDRMVKNKHGLRIVKSRILKGGIDGWGYRHISISVKSKLKTFKIHQLVAMAFLNHKRDSTQKLVVNHINHIKTDNRLENLEIITQRENANKKHLKSTSKYVGVSWSDRYKKWISQIRVDGKQIHLGSFTTEIDAHNAYQKELKTIN